MRKEAAALLSNLDPDLLNVFNCSFCSQSHVQIFSDSCKDNTENLGDFTCCLPRANFDEIDLMCTEHACVVEISQLGKDARHFTPNGVFVASGASCSSAASHRVIRALISARIPFLNSASAVSAFLSPSNMKKEVRKLKLKDGTRIPMLPSIHYPQFHKFNATSNFPIIVSIGQTRHGTGKMKVNSAEELADLEGILRNQIGIEVEVEPFVDSKYDLHVQKIGKEYKTFVRRGISRNWKSNALSSVIEQIKTSEIHKEYLEAVSTLLGGCRLLSLHLIVSRENQHFVYAFSDTLCYFGEAQEDDRRSVCALLRELLHPQPSTRPPPPPLPPRTVTGGVPSNGTAPVNGASLHAHSDTQSGPPISANSWQPEGDVTKESSFADDTMGQLKRTFAGIFGDI